MALLTPQSVDFLMCVQKHLYETGIVVNTDRRNKNTCPRHMDTFWIVVILGMLLVPAEKTQPPHFSFFIAGIVVTVLYYFTMMKFMKVLVDDCFLYVSNYLNEIKIPLSEIKDVTEIRLLRGNPVTIHLASPSEFGSKITFMPKSKGIWNYFQQHPVVDELKALVRNHKAANSQEFMKIRSDRWQLFEQIETRPVSRGGKMMHFIIPVVSAVITVSLIVFSGPMIVAADEIPKGWRKSGSHPKGYDITIDTSVKRSGKASARIESNAAVVKDGFSTLLQDIKADAYRGKRIRLSGWMKTENAHSAQLWLRLDSERKVLGFDNMDPRPVKGTTGWTKYELVLDVPEEALVILFGFFVQEKGKAWGDDFRLELVGQDVRSTNIMTAEQAKEEFPANTYKRELPAHPVNLDFES